MKLVKPESEMDDATFIKHFNARHMPMAGLSHIGGTTPGVLVSFRSYHARIHALGKEDGGRYPEREPNHTHRESE